MGQFSARKICDMLKSQIMGGVYATAPLASTRALAAELGVSRATVTAAYEQHAAEGFLETRQGAKARVAPTLATSRSRAERRRRRTSPGVLSRYGHRIAELPAPAQPLPDPLAADFRYGDLPTADFPVLAWKRALNAAMLRRPPRLRYGDPGGSSMLRTALQGYLWRARNLRCEADQIIVVNGSQQGLDLCTRLLLDPGDRAVVEDPCYAVAREALIAAGATVVPVDVGADGLRTDRLAAINDARLAYVTPSHQFPLGSVMSMGRRLALLAWAHRTGAYVIEDDYDGEYRYDINPIQPLQALADADNVIYLGTLSKTLSPTIRLGYLIVPAGLCALFTKTKRLVDRHSPTLEQEALAHLIMSGAYERHVRRVRRRNAARRAALLEALSSRLGDRVTVAGADAGLHVVVWFNDIRRRMEQDLITRAQAAGLGLYPITPLYSTPAATHRPDRAGLIVGYASLNERQIALGVSRLASLVEREQT